MFTDTDLTLLARVVDRYDDTQQPVRAATLADTFDAEESDIEECLAGLVANELLTSVADGYRPTVTARELLELDIDPESEAVILDFDPPDDPPPSGEPTDDGPGGDPPSEP